MLTWVIISSIALTFTLITSLAIHPALVEAGLDAWVVVLIDSLIGAAVMLVLTFVVAPLLNEAFAGDTAVKEVDPASDPAAGKEGAASKISVFALAAGMMGTVYMARRKG